MANYKIVTLKDPTTGEYLIPRVPRSLAYDVLDDGSIQAPIDMNADTLQGHPASDFLLKSEYTPTDLSAYMKTADANNAFAAKSHNHNGVYSPATHTHSIAQVSGLQTELNSLKTSVSNGKSAVASAITDKGVSTSATASFDTMAANIQKIVTGITVNGTEGEYTVANNNNITAGDFVQVYDQQLFNKVTESGPFDIIDVYTGTTHSPAILPYDDTHVIAVWASGYSGNDVNVRIYVRILTITPTAITSSKAVSVQTDIYDSPMLFSYWPSACFAKLSKDKIIVSGYDHNYTCIVQINNPLASNLSLSTGNAVRFGRDGQFPRFTFRISDTKFAKLWVESPNRSVNVLTGIIYTVNGTTISAATSTISIQSKLATIGYDELFMSITPKMFLQINDTKAIYFYSTREDDDYNHVHMGLNYAYLTITDTNIVLTKEDHFYGPVEETGNRHPEYAFYIYGAGALDDNKFAFISNISRSYVSPSSTTALHIYSANSNGITSIANKDISDIEIEYDNTGSYDPLINRIFPISDTRFIIQYMTTTGTIIKTNYQVVEVNNKVLTFIGNVYQLENNYMSNSLAFGYMNRVDVLYCINDIVNNNIILPYYYFNLRSNNWYDIEISFIQYHIFDKFVEPYNSGSGKQFGIANESGNNGSVISVTTP